MFYSTNVSGKLALVEGPFRPARTNMEVEAESQPQQQPRKMGPKEAKQENEGIVINDTWLGEKVTKLLSYSLMLSGIWCKALTEL